MQVHLIVWMNSCGKVFSLWFIIDTFLSLLHSSMAQKESHHREVVDDLNDQLTRVRKDLDDLTMLSRDQVSLSPSHLIWP